MFVNKRGPWSCFDRLSLAIYQHWFVSWPGNWNLITTFESRWGQIKFPSNFDCDGKAVREMGPSWVSLFQKGLWWVYSQNLLKIHNTHDDVIKWSHFPRCRPFMRGIHWSPVNSPHKGQWRGALIFSLISAWINGWVNNRDAVFLFETLWR